MRAQAGLQGCHLSLGVTPLRRAGGTFPLRPSPRSSALLPATEPQCRQRPDREPRRVLARPCGCGRCSPPVPCIAPRPLRSPGGACPCWGGHHEHVLPLSSCSVVTTLLSAPPGGPKGAAGAAASWGAWVKQTNPSVWLSQPSSPLSELPASRTDRASGSETSASAESPPCPSARSRASTACPARVTFTATTLPYTRPMRGSDGGGGCTEGRDGAEPPGQQRSRSRHGRAFIKLSSCSRQCAVKSRGI